LDKEEGGRGKAKVKRVKGGEKSKGKRRKAKIEGKTGKAKIKKVGAFLLK
jgi:hypothetical protein